MADVTVLCKAAADRARIEITNDLNADTTQAPLLNASAAKPVDVGQGTVYSPIYDPAAALTAVQAGTHYFHAVFEMVQSLHSQKHSGGIWLHCIPKTGKFEIPEKSHALLCVSRTPEDNLMVSVSPLARANLMSLTVAFKERQAEIKRATKKAKKDPSVIVPSAIELPTVPPGTKPLKVQVTCIRNSTLIRVNFLMTIRGHRILFLEPPKTTPYINRKLEWEARLLYPNYPLDELEANADRPSGVQVAPTGVHIGGDPIEGTHYTLLLRHSDNKSCCCGCCGCFGSTGGNGVAKVKMAVLSSLAKTPAPMASGSGTTAAAVDDATAAELILAVLALIPGINSRIAHRKALVLFLGPFTLFSVLAFIINFVGLAVGRR